MRMKCMLICGILMLKDWKEKDISSQFCDKNIHHFKQAYAE